jgi:hypothetical protein
MKADHLAKEGCKKQQSDLFQTYKEAKTNIKGTYRNKWKEEHQQYDANDSFCRLSIREQVIIFRLRTGHTRLRHHLYNKFRIGESDICPCDTEPMIVEPILGRCP